MTPFVSFDFRGYLARHNAGHKYQITKLTGGFVNVTVRATRTNGVSKSDDVSGNETMILKYAPPYVAGRGPDAPMTQWRQTVEARALEMVHQILASGDGMEIPRVLKHDVKEHVLCMTDLGALPNLQELFFELGGYTEFHGPPKTPSKPLTGSAPELAYFSAVGKKLGRFFALLHSPGTLQRMTSNVGFGLDYLSNPYEGPEHTITALEGTLDRLAQFPVLLAADHEHLFQMLKKDLLRPLAEEEKSFVLGDCWPAAILVGSDMQQPNPRVCVIDWEFAAIGRGLHGDVVQLLAHFELFRIAAEHQGKQAYILIIDALVQNFLEVYFAESVVQQAAWTQSQPREVYCSIFRSAFLAQATGMISCAFWKVWHCEDRTCMLDDGGHTKVQKECILVKEMVARAIEYLGIAQRTAVDFAEARSWQNSKEASRRSDNWGLLGLNMQVRRRAVQALQANQTPQFSCGGIGTAKELNVIVK